MFILKFNQQNMQAYQIFYMLIKYDGVTDLRKDTLDSILFLCY